MIGALRAVGRRTGRSLRARLTLLFLLLAVVMTLTFAAGMQAAMRYGWRDYFRPLTADYIDRLTREIGTPPDLAKAEAIAQRLPLRIRIDGPRTNWSSHSDEPFRPGPPGRGRRFENEPLPAGLPPPSLPPRSTTLSADRTANRIADGPTDHDAVGRWRPERLLADGHRIRFGLTSLPPGGTPEDRPRLIGWATFATLLVLVALAYAAVRHLLRPLNDIRVGAVRYGRGDFSSAIATRSNDELGDLARQINGMADGLHGMLDAKRQLLLAISHELRSPLTRARVNAELVAEGDARDALLRDLAEMRDLITDLLESERLVTGHAALQTEPVDLNRLVRDWVEAHTHRDGIVLALDPGVPPLALDPTRIRLLLRNLVSNALRHGRQADVSTPLAPVVRTSFREGRVLVTVRDAGTGIDEDQLPRLTEAFYRPDRARQRATGGVGLGLYLCRLVAEAHGGTLGLRNTRPGFEAEVQLPVPMT